jgi:predicted amidophosphoribosyltransferase
MPGEKPAPGGTTTLVPYLFPAAELLLSLKYKGPPHLAHEFGRRLAIKISALGMPTPDLLIPVPPHPLRLFSRGYNRALEITRSLGAKLSFPVD